jgi:hypothetical protein
LPGDEVTATSPFLGVATTCGRSLIGAGATAHADPHNVKIKAPQPRRYFGMLIPQTRAETNRIFRKMSYLLAD